MKRVAIVNGAARQFKYNKFLTEKYKEMGFSVKEFKFNPLLLFSCHLHKYLESTVREIVHDHDVIHCESGGYFPIIHYYVDQNIKKPFIMECPVLKSSTGTLLAGLNLSKSYEVKDNLIVQKVLDTVSFTPKWTEKTLENLRHLKKKDQVLLLASHSDTVSDNRGNEEVFHHYFEKGKHGKLFFENDFDIVKKYIEGHDERKF